MKLPEGITPEIMEELVNSPGETISSFASGANAPSVHRPKVTHAINEGQQNIRPQIGGHVSGGDYITVSSNLARKLAEGDERMRAVAAKQRAEIKQREEEVSPDSILGRLAYLERNLKKATAELNKLKKQTDDNAEA